MIKGRRANILLSEFLKKVVDWYDIQQKTLIRAKKKDPVVDAKEMQNVPEFLCIDNDANLRRISEYKYL